MNPRLGMPGLTGSSARFLNGSAFAFAAKITTAVMMLAINAMLARLLAPTDMGAYFLAYSIVVVTASVAILGLNVAAVRFVAADIASRECSGARAIITRVLTAATVSASAAALMIAVWPGRTILENVFDSPSLAAASLLLGVWMVATALRMVTADVLRGLQDMRLAALLSGPAVLLVTVLAIVVMHVLDAPANIPTVVGVMAATAVITTAIALYVLWSKMRRMPRGISAVSTRSLLAVGAPLTLATLLTSQTRELSMWILAIHRPLAEVSLYGAATRIMLTVALPFMAASFAIAPLIAEKHAKERLLTDALTLRAFNTLVAVPSLAITLVVVAFPEQLLAILFGDAYAAGSAMLIVLALGRAVPVLVGPTNEALSMTGNERAVMVLSVATAIPLIAGSALVAPVHGGLGVAWVVALVLTARSALSAVLVKNRLGIWMFPTFSWIVLKRALLAPSAEPAGT